MVELSQDHSIPDVFAAAVGCVLLPIGNFDGISDMALLDAYTKMMVKLGEFSKDFGKSIEDGKITTSEIARLERDMYAMNQAGAELLSRAKFLVQDKDQA